MVTARIDLQGLSEELNQFKDGFDSWAQQSVAFAEAEKDKHLRHLRDLQTNIRNLHQQQQELEKRALEVQQRLHDEKEQVADLEAELSKVQAEQNALPALLQEVQAALDAEARSADADASDFATRETEQQKTVSGVNEALQMYQQRLGLSFTHNTSEGSVDMVFTMIDSEQPDKEFKLSVAISEVDDRYVARSCVPPLANIQALIDELNIDGSFAKFVRAARVAFQATVPK